MLTDATHCRDSADICRFHGMLGRSPGLDTSMIGSDKQPTTKQRSWSMEYNDHDIDISSPYKLKEACQTAHAHVPCFLPTSDERVLSSMSNEKDSKASATNVSLLYPSLDQDAALLASLGYKQGEFPRYERSDRRLILVP